MSELKNNEYFENYFAGMDTVTEEFPEKPKKRTGDYFEDYFAGFDDVNGKSPLMTSEEQLNEYKAMIKKATKEDVVLNEEDNRRFEESIQRAKSVDLQPKKEERKVKNIYVNKDLIKKGIATISLCALITLAGMGVIQTANSIYTEMNDPLKMTNLSKTIGTMVYDEENQASIVYNNTRRNGNYFYYKHDGIAQDLLKLDGVLFDYAFCAACSDMNDNIDNKVGVDGLSNIDAVIHYLKAYSNSPTYKNAYVADAFKNVSSLSEYLIKNNYIDENGNASLSKFKDVCNQNAQLVYGMVQEQMGGTTK